MVSMKVSDAAIGDYLDRNPSTTYDPRVEPDLSPDPIITVRSQPFPDFGVDPTLNELTVKLADYGEGERAQHCSRLFVLTIPTT
jgi:serine/threonine-protein kinase SRPK3